MKKYKMTDTWECEPDYTTTEKDLFILAYELYCGEPVCEELEEAKKEFGTDIDKVIDYVEKECGWRAKAINQDSEDNEQDEWQNLNSKLAPGANADISEFEQVNQEEQLKQFKSRYKNWK